MRFWRIDREAVEEACDFLGINGPVDVVLLNGYESQIGKLEVSGYHKVTPRGHEVGLSKAQDRASAGRTLWHELRHAAQHEEAPEGPTAFRQRITEKTVLIEQGLLGDLSLPVHQRVITEVPEEADASAHEALNASLPLTRPLLQWRRP